MEVIAGSYQRREAIDGQACCSLIETGVGSDVATVDVFSVASVGGKSGDEQVAIGPRSDRQIHLVRPPSVLNKVQSPVQFHLPRHRLTEKGIWKKVFLVIVFLF